MTMSLLNSLLRWTLARAASAIVVVAAIPRRAWSAFARRRQARKARPERVQLPSVYDWHPSASSAPRRRIGVRAVPIDRIVGTTRHPSQNTGDFLPLPGLRGRNWRARWQRINRAMDRLETLPPVDLVQVGEGYFVADGHNRVAAARRAGAIEIDADVTQLVVPGVTRPGQATIDATTLVGAAELRRAAAGGQSRTVQRRDAVDEVSRRDLLRGDGERR